MLRLIRSKGVGIYFITQNPLDIPEDVLGQLGTKVQHALRASTPKDQKTIKAVAASFVTTLGIGEALVSVLGQDGSPQPVEKTLISPPESQIGPLSAEALNTVVQHSPLQGRYDQSVDRQSAYELLKERAEAAQAQQAREQAELGAAKQRQKQEREQRRRKGGGRRRQSAGEAMIKSAARAIGSQIGRWIRRGVLGSIFRR